jgi:hypothetical protein
MKDRTQEIKELWESTPQFALEAALSADLETFIKSATECHKWIVDFQLKYKDEFAPLTGLDFLKEEV